MPGMALAKRSHQAFRPVPTASSRDENILLVAGRLSLHATMWSVFGSSLSALGTAKILNQELGLSEVVSGVWWSSPIVFRAWASFWRHNGDQEVDHECPRWAMSHAGTEHVNRTMGRILPMVLKEYYRMRMGGLGLSSLLYAGAPKVSLILRVR